MVGPYKAGVVSHATNDETAKNMVDPYKAGMVNHAMMNETMKITDTIFICHMCCIYRWRQIKNYRLAKKMPVRYITKVYMWSPFVLQLKFYLLHTAQMQFVLHSPQAQCSLRLPPWCCSICLVYWQVRLPYRAGACMPYVYLDCYVALVFCV